MIDDAMSLVARIACIVGVVAGTSIVMLPGSAVAATAEVIDDPTEDLPEVAADVVVFRAGAGERNVVTAQVEVDPDIEENVWRITDAGAVIVAEPPCRAEDLHTVVCPPRPDHYVDRARFELGDLGDRFRTSTPPDALDARGTFSANGGPGDDRLIGAGALNILDGGDGNDVLRATAAGDGHVLNGGPGDDRLWGHRDFDELDGGGGRDELYGRGGDDIMTDGDREGAAGDAGPGPDLFDGGSDGCCVIAAGDRVSYRGRSAPISVDLASSRVGGQIGEGDLLIDVESVEGGSGDDRLFGDGESNAFIGRPGRDRLAGRGGDDTLIPGIGGGRVSCGTGSDIAGPTTSKDRLDLDCELLDSRQLGIYWLSVQPTVTPTGRPIYRVRCPEADDESPFLFASCAGTLHVREASKRERLLGTGTFPRGRWAHRSVEIDLTPLGRRLSARGGALATMKLRFHVRSSGYAWSAGLRWTIRFRLRR